MFNSLVSPWISLFWDTSLVYTSLLYQISHTMSSPTSVGGRGDQVGGFQEIEGRMREQIRVLQEQRAAAMMTEIVDLQREKDMAVGKLKRMERSVTGDGIGRRWGECGR